MATQSLRRTSSHVIQLPHAPAWAFPRRFGALLKETADEWVADNVPSLSASLAFYAVLALLPFLIVVVGISAQVFGQKAAQGQLNWEIQDLIGMEGGQAIQGLIQLGHHSTTITVLGLLPLVLGASALVMELRDGLNTIWHVRRGQAATGLTGFLHIVRERFYLFGLIAGAGILLIASLALNALVVAVSAESGLFLPISPTLLHLTTFIGSFLVVTMLFAAVYKLVPDVCLKWNDVMVGAGFTSLLFTVGKQCIGMYLGKASYGSTYGTAGSFVIVLLWVYYSAQLFFFGAEFTKVFARRIHPRKAVQEPRPTV